MTFYARPSWRLVGQVVADAFVVVWVFVWWTIGRMLDGMLRGISVAAAQTALAASDIKGQLATAADQAGKIPVVGDGLRQPLVGIGSSLSGLIAAADGQSVQLAGIASTIGLATFAIPALAVIAVWLPRRLRFAYKARDLREMMGDPRGIELLAFRALTLRPLPVLLSASPDPLAAWERRDPTALLRLANLALEGEGVRPPTD